MKNHNSGIYFVTVKHHSHYSKYDKVILLPKSTSNKFIRLKKSSDSPNSLHDGRFSEACTRGHQTIGPSTI